MRFLPTFLTAFANFVHECGTVPAAVLDDLEAVVNIVFLVYPTQSMFPKVKYATCDALVRLLVALHLKHRALDAMLPRLVYRGLTLTISGSQVSCFAPAGSLIGRGSAEMDMRSFQFVGFRLPLSRPGTNNVGFADTLRDVIQPRLFIEVVARSIDHNVLD